MKQPEPGYDGNVIAPVRYNKNIPAGAKLLYAEIRALTRSKGFCWASNKYFAGLYGKSPNTISKWVNALKKEGFISVEIIPNKGNFRKITLYQQIVRPITKNRETPITKNRETHKNNTVEVKNNEIRGIHRYWQNSINKPNLSLTTDRRRIIKTRLKTNSVEKLKLAIDGLLKDDWLMGRAPNSTKPYYDFATIFRNDAKVEMLVDLAENGNNKHGKNKKNGKKTSEEFYKSIGAKPKV